jgi:MarR family transcriptional regulator, organic hydroperoxide resistance regulator
MFMRLEEVRNFWTKVLGIHGPQWMIVMTLRCLDQGEGASVQAIADMLQVNPTFVTSQSRFLESKGLVRRTASGDHAATMILSLTKEARRHLAELASQQRKS